MAIIVEAAVANPSCRLTDARFTPDGASVVYTEGGHMTKGDIRTQRLGAPNSQSLGIPNAVLLAVSRQGELAVLVPGAKPLFEMGYRTNPGVLARVPLAGGAPRERSWGTLARGHFARWALVVVSR